MINEKIAYKVLSDIRGLSVSKKEILKNPEIFIDKIFEYAAALKNVDIDSMLNFDFDTQKKIKTLEKKVEELTAKNKALMASNKEKQNILAQTEYILSVIENAKQQQKRELTSTV